MNRIWIALLCTFLSLTLTISNAFATFLPPNNLYLQDNVNNLISMTENEFNESINSVMVFYRPIANAHGASLNANKAWSDSNVNASAAESGNNWYINMYGGLARRPEITKDGFTAVVCHEIGHHLAGYYFKAIGYWAASEGESDYFTTHACLPMVWRNQKADNASYRDTVHPYAKNLCDQNWHTGDDQNLCYRIAEASASLARMLAAITVGEAEPRFDTPSTIDTPNTLVLHPPAQCRLDTFLAGSICSVPFNSHFIPGNVGGSGDNSSEAEQLSTQSSCHASAGVVVGARPSCWFKPTLEFLPIKILNWNAIALNGNANNTIEPGASVALQYTLTNASNTQTPKNINGVIWSHNAGISIETPAQSFADILVKGQTVSNANPFILKLSNSIKCSNKTEITFRAFSDIGAIEQKQELKLGMPMLVDLGSITQEILIPDFDNPGITSILNVTKEGFSRHVEVHINLMHSNVSDLFIMLTSPDGKNIIVWNRAFANGTEINTTISRNIEVITHGKWTLTIADKNKNATGKLISWGIKATQNVCEINQ